MSITAFSNIIGRYDINFFIDNSANYYAHIDKDKKETLAEHTVLVFSYFNKLCKVFNLDLIVDNLIDKIVKKNDCIKNVPYELIKELFVGTFFYHDFGKVNENFQVEKMKNSAFTKTENLFSSKHSIISFILYIVYYYQKIYFEKEIENDNLFLILFLFAYNILQHHSVLLDPFDREILKDKIIESEKYIKLNTQINTSNLEQFNRFLTNLNKDTLSSIIDKNFKETSDIFVLLKLNYSLLTQCDYYASNEFSSNIVIEKFGILDNDLKSKIINNTYSIPYNKGLNFQSNKDIFNSNISDINALRRDLAQEIIINLKENKDNKLFYIEAPTGSGKTNLSLLALVELLKINNNIKKVFYVFPYINIITQTKEHFVENLKLSNDDYIELHSKASFSENYSEDESLADSDIKYYLDTLFGNFPISFISHIKFFNILFSNSKKNNYYLTNLIDSVVIIDEIQAYSPKEWDKIDYFLKLFSDCFNITFILMSATLPKIGNIKTQYSQQFPTNFVSLVKEPSIYYHHKLFKNRVIFKELPDKKITMDKLLYIVIDESEKYYKKYKNVKTIIEFVTKKRAQEFYNLVKDLQKTDPRLQFYKLFILSGNILEPRRREIIHHLKQNNYDSKIILVTTQVIEAGVDIDMDIGFKDQSLLDSEEQIAGRINRNAKKENSVLTIFDTGDRAKVYNKDLRYKLCKNFTENEYIYMLINKEFEGYYKKVFEYIQSSNEDMLHGGTLESTLFHMKQMNYSKIEESFKLIKENSISVFVPLEIEKKFFSDNEIEYLKKFFDISIDDRYIQGEKVWDAYVSIVENKHVDFIKNEINLKKIIPILSKYCFNMSYNIETYKSLCHYAKEKHGFIYLLYYHEIYTFEDGLKTNIETDSNFI